MSATPRPRSCCPTRPQQHRLRYFSPLAEVAFCGHATVATAVALADRDGPGELDLITLAGPIRVTTIADGSGLVATLTSPATHTRPVREAVLSEALAAIGWEPDDLDPAFPPHVAFAGNDHLVLGVKSLATLAGLDYDFDRLAELMRQEHWTTVHLFFAEGDGVFHVRNAFPPGGVVEDPATGAAAAAFGGYLRSLGLIPLPARLTLLQGRDMGRPSRLLVDLDPDADTVRVSGSATRLTRADDDVDGRQDGARHRRHRRHRQGHRRGPGGDGRARHDRRPGRRPRRGRGSADPRRHRRTGRLPRRRRVIPVGGTTARCRGPGPPASDRCAGEQRRRLLEHPPPHGRRARAHLRSQPPRAVPAHQPAPGSAEARNDRPGGDGLVPRARPGQHRLRRPAGRTALLRRPRLQPVQARQPPVLLRAGAETAGHQRHRQRTASGRREHRVRSGGPRPHPAGTRSTAAALPERPGPRCRHLDPAGGRSGARGRHGPLLRQEPAQELLLAQPRRGGRSSALAGERPGWRRAV